MGEARDAEFNLFSFATRIADYVQEVGRDLKKEANKLILYLVGLAFLACFGLTLVFEQDWLAVVLPGVVILLVFVRDFRNRPRQTPEAMQVAAYLKYLVQLEKDIRRDAPQTHPTAVAAYAHLSNQIQTHRINRVDLLQFSGLNSRDLVREIAQSSPAVQVRMLVYDPERAGRFDAGQPNHRSRIESVVDDIELLAGDDASNGFKVEVRYYCTEPSLSAIIIDGAFVSVSWYLTFPDAGNQEIVRLRGHDSVAITAAGDAAAALVKFAEAHFNQLWETARVRE
jgi:hypothetical protein